MCLKHLIIEEELKRRRRPAVGPEPLELPMYLPLLPEERHSEDEDEDGQPSRVIIIDMFDYSEVEV